MPMAPCPEGLRISSGPFPSGLPDPPRVTLYLPPDYEHGNREYPLSLFLDGQNLFGDAGSFRGGWHMHHLLDRRACQGARVPVVVGIHTGGPARASLLSPWSEDPEVEPLGDRFLDWLTGPLMRTVRTEVRILPGPEHTLIGGSSLGGLLSLYAFFRHPEVFGRAIVMSPSLGVSGGKLGPIVPFVAASPRSSGRIYLDAGGRECPCGHVLEHAERMAELLAQKGFLPGRDLLWFPDAEGDHDEFHWRSRLPRAISFMCDH